MEKIIQVIEESPAFSVLFLAIKFDNRFTIYVNKINAEYMITYQDHRKGKFLKYSGGLDSETYNNFKKYIIFHTQDYVINYIDGYITIEAKKHFKNNMFNISIEPGIEPFFDVYKSFT